MKIYYGYKEFRGLKPVVTIGMFDGVHRGHKRLIDLVVKRAEEIGGESVVITFDPHPRIIISGEDKNLRFITSLEERKYLLKKAGIKHLIIIPFDRIFSQLSACDFVREVLVDGISIKHLVVGFNHHIGYKSPDLKETIFECAERYGFTARREEALRVDGLAVSSTIIRDFLNEGRLFDANKLLGYDYFLRGRVIEGKKIGRIMGYPTANIKPDYQNKLIPLDGVYAVEVDINGELYKAMLYIGTRPTLEKGGGIRTIEANIFDFNDNIYGSSVTINFRHRIRDDIKFENTELLSEQINRDKEETLRLLT